MTYIYIPLTVHGAFISVPLPEYEQLEGRDFVLFTALFPAVNKVPRIK